MMLWPGDLCQALHDLRGLGLPCTLVPPVMEHYHRQRERELQDQGRRLQMGATLQRVVLSGASEPFHNTVPCAHNSLKTALPGESFPTLQTRRLGPHLVNDQGHLGFSITLYSLAIPSMSMMHPDHTRPYIFPVLNVFVHSFTCLFTMYRYAHDTVHM